MYSSLFSSCFAPVLALLYTSASARQITFPPIAAVHQIPYQSPISDYRSDLLANTPAFTGLYTFANVPYVHCLSDEKEVEKYDIAFLGAPFDTVRYPLSSLLIP